MKTRFLIFLILLSGCSNDNSKCEYRYVHHEFGFYNYSGTLLNDSIRIGSWSFYDVGKLDSIVDYDMGIEMKVTEFYNGAIYSYRFQDSFLFDMDVLELMKDYNSGNLFSDNETGRKIYLTNCLSCHQNNFTNDLIRRKAIDSLYENTKSRIFETEKGNWKYIKGNRDHIILSAMTEREIELLKSFLNKDQAIRVYTD